MLSTPFFVFLFVSLSNSLSLDEFFPFGPKAGDLNIQPNDDESIGPLQLPYVFPYFDNNHRQIWIANNGLFSFLEPIRQFVPDPFPLGNNSRLVAGFWTDIDTRGVLNDTGNKVYYQIHSNMQRANYTQSIFNKSRNYVRRFFPEHHSFEPTMVIKATWYRVGAYSSRVDKLNTFQIVLSTDGDRSFVCFLYHDIQWVAPGNNDTNYAQAGFNAGDGITFEILPHSNTKDIFQLTNESNVNIPGLFLFRVDTERIDSGGCNHNVTMLYFRPRTSSQLGSTAIYIQGPCYTNETLVKCRFGSSSEVIDGFVINEFQAVCLTPIASSPGPISVSVSIDDGITFIPAGTLIYAPLQFGSDQVTIEAEDSDDLLNLEQHIKVTWHFSEIAKNTFPNGTKVDIELWNVTLNQHSQFEKDNRFILLGQNLDLNDSAHVQLPITIFYISTCFIRVVARFNSHTYAGLNTGLLVVRSHRSLAPELCQTWAAKQPDPTSWNNELLPCPMTRSQALVARCCYTYDRQCYVNNPNSNNCWLHRARLERSETSAIECFLSTTSNRHSAGAECCYDSNGTIITDGIGAGTDNRYHSTTSVVNHFFHDTLPYLQCCIMSEDFNVCNIYKQYRPPRNGCNTMGKDGQMWGDPHFSTLDGLSYTFNGYGEYTYLAISNSTSQLASFDTINQSYIFISQIRTIPLFPNNVTVTKGFAAESNNDNAQSVSLTISRRQHLILRRGNEILEFEENNERLYFPELTINRLDGNNNSRFSFSWTIGVTIEINVIKMKSPSEQLVLNVGASVAPIYRGRTYGLLGVYDGISKNDLRSRNGTTIFSNASLEQIHKDFGVTWAIDPTSSLFYYESDQSAPFFYERNLEFIPSFVDPIATDNSSIREICKIDPTLPTLLWSVAQRTCYYDFSMTNDSYFAQASLAAGNEILSIRETQKLPPSFDSSLPSKMNLTQGQLVSLNISATSEDLSGVVLLSILNKPVNSNVDKNTNMFRWTAFKGEHHLNIQANDTTNNLSSNYRVIFYVKAIDAVTIIGTGEGTSNRFNKFISVLSIIGMFILLP